MHKEEATILLIDDDEDVLTAARFLLKKHFSTIITANTPDKINTLLQENRFDIALLDMNFTTGATSGKEGLELLKKIKQIAEYTKVIMMTAYGDIDLAIKAIKEGATDFIVKPWDNAKLVSTILAALKKGISKTDSPSPHNNPIVEDTGYHRPFSEVERIFMFLDIRSSTSIAEKLGHVKYFELLNDFFADIADPISNNKGQIYQYVGDEVVVSWALEDGLENANCLNCFFHIKHVIEQKKESYQSKYSLKPDFKAGLHMGKVSTGTVGTLKKEIIYTGDVLNTTSRIEGLCNVYNKNLLASKILIDHIGTHDGYLPQQIGAINLRGKSDEVILYTVEPKTISTVDDFS